ncbi:MAG: amino acid ABC transporter substrate-binding protein [Pseudolabrys sp.]|jgi:branched-chain amino acid transport system substrate-binding protein
MRTSITLALGVAGAIFAYNVASAADVITLGAAVSETGKYSANGVFTEKGYQLAVDKINSQGGVKVGGKTYKLAVKFYDDESSPARGAELVDRLVKQDGIKFILGPYSSGLTKAVAPETERLKVPMVEANGAARSLFTNGYKYLFATLTTADQYLASAIDLAAANAGALKKKPNQIKVAVVVENDPFSKDVRKGVVDRMKKYGMKLVVDDQLPRDLSDMTATLTKVKALKPDVLIISGHSKGAATGVREIAEQHLTTPIVAMTHCDSAQIIKKFGKQAGYILCATQWAPTLTYKGKVFGSAGDYAKAFKARYKVDPPYQAAESSAAVITYADALHRAGKLDKEAVRDALAKTDLMTFYGPIKFDETGKNAGKPMALFQVLDGKYVVVSPPKFAEKKAVIPRPAMN